MSRAEEPTRPSLAHVEQWVQATCRDLGLEVNGGGDDLFEAGGTSLVVIKLVGRAEKEFGEDCLPPDDIYEHSALDEIAATIARNGTAAPGAEHLAGARREEA
jgi:hypothetical protein